jgi:hypothetical protein
VQQDRVDELQTDLEEMTFEKDTRIQQLQQKCDEKQTMLDEMDCERKRTAALLGQLENTVGACYLYRPAHVQGVRNAHKLFPHVPYHTAPTTSIVLPYCGS